MEFNKKNSFENEIQEAWRTDIFSANNFYDEVARKTLENRLFPFVEVTDRFSRKSVSFQMSKSDQLHSWLKYKEGFSAELVNKLLDEMGISNHDKILDPFLGSGTTSLVCKLRGIDSIGYDILPISKVSIEAKEAIYKYDVNEIESALNEIESLEIPKNYAGKINCINITKGAYPDENEKQLVFYCMWNEQSSYSDIIKNLIKLCLINLLERVSYTAKDGQYLRWDYRAPKVIEANIKRQAQGKKPFVSKLNKGELPRVKEILILELQSRMLDIINIQKQGIDDQSKIEYYLTSALLGMPLLDSESIDGVITSPPYCNRYDYTRTYALELAFMGIGEKEIRELRQSLLSCTVESKSKIKILEDYYSNLNRINDYNHIINILNSCQALNEVNNALIVRAKNDEINNKGILQMVNGYFTDLCFIYYELYRVCKPGAKIAFVNDNVRYGGEVIPVDFISTDLAERIGFNTVKIYTLQQQKGNSSQQMKKYGRVPLRKSITIWEKR